MQIIHSFVVSLEIVLNTCSLSKSVSREATWRAAKKIQRCANLFLTKRATQNSRMTQTRFRLTRREWRRHLCRWHIARLLKSRGSFSTMTAYIYMHIYTYSQAREHREQRSEHLPFGFKWELVRATRSPLRHIVALKIYLHYIHIYMLSTCSWCAKYVHASEIGILRFYTFEKCLDLKIRRIILRYTQCR